MVVSPSSRRIVALLCAIVVGRGEAFAFDARDRRDNPQTTSASNEQEPLIPPEQLDSLTAPVALYPDPLLAQVLAASTYPLEIMQLHQWLTRNSALKDKALADAVAQQPWDPSIQAMAVLPDVVKRLANDIQWTTELGNAFLAQQSDVMDAVQRMRAKAEGAGNLKTTKEQVVETQTVENKSVIVIEQASPEIVYVPSYEPTVVFGPPVYPYPSIYYPPAGYYAAGMAVSFGVGVAMGAFWGSGGGWGWNAGWGHNDIEINRNNNFVRNTNVAANRSGTWQHNSAHRGGAPYRDRTTANRYGGTARGDSLTNRQASARQQIASQRGNAAGGRTGTSGSVNRGDLSSRSAGAGVATQSRGGTSSLGTRSAGGDHIGQRDLRAAPAARTRSETDRRSTAGPRRVRAAIVAPPACSLATAAAAAQDPPEVTAAAAAAAVGVAAGVGAEVAVDDSSQSCHRNVVMKSTHTGGTLSRVSFTIFLCLFTAAVATGQHVAPRTPPRSTSVVRSAPAPNVKTFATPQQAANALIEAADRFDVRTFEELFGVDDTDVVLSGEYAQDRDRARKFVAAAHEKNSVSIDPTRRARAFLLVGKDDWPFPVPIVKRAAGWSFDVKSGRQELLNRRIGANELDAIAICRGYVEAQHEYALQKRNGYGVNQYAQRIISTPGKQDGLAWQTADGTWEGPVGEAVARAVEKGYSSGEPYHGYFYKVLKGQGSAAPLGEMDFVVNGVMIGGFALVAAPAVYGVTGVKTFIVSHDGVVYERDFGHATPDELSKIDRFNPDQSWTPVPEE